MTAKNKPNKHHNNDLYDDVEKLKATLFDTAFDAREKAGDLFHNSVEEIKDQTNGLKDKIINYTSEKPLQSLTLAFLAGVTLGNLLRK